MKTEIEISQRSKELKKFLDNSGDYYLAFSPRSYEELTNKFKQVKSEYDMINRVSTKTEKELIDILKEKNDMYDTVPKSDSNKLCELQGEILAIRWLLK